MHFLWKNGPNLQGKHSVSAHKNTLNYCKISYVARFWDFPKRDICPNNLHYPTFYHLHQISPPKNTHPPKPVSGQVATLWDLQVDFLISKVRVFGDPASTWDPLDPMSAGPISFPYKPRDSYHLSLRLFQHTELEHTPKRSLYQQALIRDSFHNWRCRGIAERVCDIGVCCNFLGLRCSF